MTSPGLRALRARKRRHLPAGGTRGTSPAPAATRGAYVSARTQELRDRATSPTMHDTTHQVAPCTQAAGEPTPRRRGVYPISICGCWWIFDRPSPCPSHTNPKETQ